MPRPSLLLLGLVWEPHSGVAALLRLRVCLHIVQVVAEARLDPGLGQMGQHLPRHTHWVGPCLPTSPSTCALAHLGKIRFVLKSSSSPSLAKVTFTSCPHFLIGGPRLTRPLLSSTSSPAVGLLETRQPALGLIFPTDGCVGLAEL